MAIQLQEFAKRVLFGTTIEEKLDYPREEIVDTAPGYPIITPRSLSRPKHLSPRDNSKRVNHPRASMLIDEQERGRLLHFFANHELLATELMALALLKFPDAPKSFRAGLLNTLKEEQIHTRIYMHRMKQCGVEFGELQLSDYFWKSVSSMEDPLDYVTRLSLTFEQANLDYSREYSKIFAEVGDQNTANILERIYQDEIQHVGFGLKWFRRWRQSGKSDWEAFKQKLIFPLSPSRAKGNIYNADGRKAAGLDRAFIEDLQVYQQSRGRTPIIRWFNPDAEAYASQNSAKPVENSNPTLQQDLAFLPAYLSRKDDILIVPQRPSREFLKSIQDLGFPLPELVSQSSPAGIPSIKRKIGGIRPWAWTPDAIELFSDIFPRVTRSPKVSELWNSDIRLLHSKPWAMEQAETLLTKSAGDWIAPSGTLGKPVSSLRELKRVRGELGEKGYPNIVCKAPFATAGRGNRCLMEKEAISGSMWQWLDDIWLKQAIVIIEPWLERVFDFSIHFYVKNGSIELQAITRLFNNARGQFTGVLSNGLGSIRNEALNRLLLSDDRGKPRVYRWYEEKLVTWLRSILDKSKYTGPLSIDAFVYQEPEGSLLLKPISEINPRYTMGRIGHELGTRIAGGSKGLFQIVNKSRLRQMGYSTFSDYCEELKQYHPIQATETSKLQIASGSFPLTDPSNAQKFAAVYHVRKRFSELPV